MITSVTWSWEILGTKRDADIWIHSSDLEQKRSPHGSQKKAKWKKS